MKGHIKGTGGNCEPQDPTQLLEVFTDTCQVDDTELDISTVGMARRYDLLIREPLETDHDYDDIPQVSSLSEFQDAVLPYVSGSAAKITARFTICPNCCEALGSRTHGSNSPFLNFKDQGGLFKPSKSVVTICKLTELKIRQLLRQTQGKPPQGEFFRITSIELILYTLSCSSVKVDLDCQRFLYFHSTSSVQIQNVTW